MDAGWEATGVHLRQRWPAWPYRQNADGTGDAEPLLIDEDAVDLAARDWTPDGDSLLFERRASDSGGGNQSDLALLSLGEVSTVEPLLGSEFSETRAALSPNGQWIAYDSGRAGNIDVFVERFPSLGDRQRVSTEGGRRARWSADGRRLYFQTDTADRLMVAPVRPRRVSAREALTQHPRDLVPGLREQFDGTLWQLERLRTHHVHLTKPQNLGTGGEPGVDDWARHDPQSDQRDHERPERPGFASREPEVKS